MDLPILDFNVTQILDHPNAILIFFGILRCCSGENHFGAAVTRLVYRPNNNPNTNNQNVAVKENKGRPFNVAVVLLE